jgi:hypothetical protein
MVRQNHRARPPQWLSRANHPGWSVPDNQSESVLRAGDRKQRRKLKVTNTERAMKTKYYAVVNQDGSGPAFGIGTTPTEANRDAQQWTDNLAGTKVAEISPAAYEAVKAGNPDAWTR